MALRRATKKSYNSRRRMDSPWQKIPKMWYCFLSGSRLIDAGTGKRSPYHLMTYWIDNPRQPPIIHYNWRLDRPWVPLLSNCFPQGQRWGSHILMLSLIPVAIVMVSFVIRSPTAVIGGARSQSPECGAAAARKRAWSRGPLALSRSSFAIFFATSCPTPSAFLAWLQLENRLLSASSMHR